MSCLGSYPLYTSYAFILPRTTFFPVETSVDVPLCTPIPLVEIFGHMLPWMLVLTVETAMLSVKTSMHVLHKHPYTCFCGHTYTYFYVSVCPCTCFCENTCTCPHKHPCSQWLLWVYICRFVQNKVPLVSCIGGIAQWSFFHVITFTNGSEVHQLFSKDGAKLTFTQDILHLYTTDNHLLTTHIPSNVWV